MLKKKKMLFSRIKDACTREMGLKRTMWDFWTHFLLYNSPRSCDINDIRTSKDYLNLIAPELSELLVKRYQLLRKIYYAAPIGRRSLAAYFQLGEKVLRREVQLLREQGLLTVEQQGISLTPSGKCWLPPLRLL